MTAATGAIPGAGMDDATQTPGGGDAITDGTPAASSGAPGTGDLGSQDYLGRIRVDPDFAESEVRKHQSRADKMEAEVRKLTESTGGNSEAIRSLLGQGLTPDMIAAAATNYFVLRSNPHTQESVLGLERTGMIPEAPMQNTSTDDDEYLSDEQREIRELRTTIESLKQQQAGLTQTTGSAALQGHLERFQKENFLTQDEFEAVKQGMTPQVKQWGSNEQGLNLLRSLQDPSAYDTVEALAWKFVPRDVRFQLGERKRLHDQNRVEPFRTDVPTDTSTTGRELPAEVKGALNALQFARTNPDKI